MPRPRGFIEDWQPLPKTLELVNQVREVLDDNSEYLPMTLRQIFYNLFSNYGYEKTEKSYKRLCETMNKARRAEFIPMDHIRDDELKRKDPENQWHSADHFINTVKSYENRFRLYRQEGQDQHIFVWCEAGGMVPQLAKYCHEYGITVLSSGGFDSLTTKHNFAKECSDHDHVVVLHIGDHDPSGVHMHSSLDEDLQAFVEAFGCSVEVQRIAVVPWQIEEYNLPTAPPKATDRRSFEGLTTQAEAIPPGTLKEIVIDHIEGLMDMGTYNAVIEREDEVREKLKEAFKDL